MPPKRKETRDKGSGVFRPNNEEPQHPPPEQPSVEHQNEDQVDDQHEELEVPHGHNQAKGSFVPDPMAEELSAAINLEEVSKIMSDAILVGLRTLIKRGTDKKSCDKEVNQGSNQPKEPDQGSGSSKAGDFHRPMVIIPNQPNPEERYTPPHRREEAVGMKFQPNSRNNGLGSSKQPMNQVYGVTNPVCQPEAYEEMMNNGFQGVNNGMHTRGAQYPPHPFPLRNLAMVDPDTVRDMVQELYGPGLRQIGRPEFHKPYPEVMDMTNPYPKGYKVPTFNLFSGEDGLSSVEHIARFTIQCGGLANLENFAQLKLRLFPNSLTGIAFAWYTSLPTNSVLSWQEMERQFHTQFYRAEPEVCIADLSRLSQRNGEPTDAFIDRFKRMRNKCKVFLLDIEFVKMAQKGLDFELRKKFQGMEFRDFFELVAKVGEYEELLKEESYKKKITIGSYFQEVEEIALAEIPAGSCVCPLIKKKLDESWKKNVQSTLEMQYTFDVSKADDIFDYLVKEKFITFPQDHRVPSKEELKGREYCKYHNSFNHAIKNCWAFKNVLQDRINKGVIKFPEKKEAMTIDDDPFPPAAAINVNVTDLRALLNEKTEGKLFQERNKRKCWVPKGKLFEVENDVRKKIMNTGTVFPGSHSRDLGESMVFGPGNQHFSKRMMASQPRDQVFTVKSSYQNKKSQGYLGESSRQGSRSHPHIGESTAFWSRNQHFSKRMMNSELQGQSITVKSTHQNMGSQGYPCEPSYAGPKFRIYMECLEMGSHEKQNIPRKIRFVLSPRCEIGDSWKVAQHNNFPRPFTKTQKTKLLRPRVSMRISKKKSKRRFSGITIKDKQGDLSSEEEVNVERKITFKIGQIIDCDTGSVSSVLKTPVIMPQGSVIESNKI